MGIMDTIKNFTSRYEEDYDEMDYGPQEVEEDMELRATRTRDISSRKLVRGSTNLRPHVNKGEMVICQPTNFEEDAINICEHLKDGKPVIINIEQMEQSEAQRAIDFVSGAGCALDCNNNEVSSTIFLFAPKDMDVSKDSRATGRRNKKAVSAY